MEELQSFNSDSKLIQHIRDDFQEVLEGAEYWETDHMTGALPFTGTLIVTLDEIGIEMLEGRSGIDLINVQVGSPSYEAGLHTGDTILEIDDKPGADFYLKGRDYWYKRGHKAQPPPNPTF
jgi:C-terminal processing protease CtpA/Prc